MTFHGRSALLLVMVLAGLACSSPPGITGLLPSDSPAPAAPPPPTPARKVAGNAVPLGVNLSGVIYYLNVVPFTNALMQSDDFESLDFRREGEGFSPWRTDFAEKIPRDQDGYPLEIPYPVPGHRYPQLLRTAAFRVLYDEDYVLLYEGEGEVGFHPYPVEVRKNEPGRMELRIRTQADTGVFFLTIARSERSNPVHSMRMVPLSMEKVYKRHPFHPEFLKLHEGSGALRFMDWGQINGSKLQKWSERKLPNQIAQAGAGGVAHEYMVELSNRLQADPWICIPHLADDDYVRKLAELLRDSVHPERKIYIEYSNELWNQMFIQSRWASEQGCKAGLNEFAPQPGSCSDHGVAVAAGHKWNAKRSTEIFRIFEQTFGDSRRFVKVISAMAAWSGVAENLLTAVKDKRINPHGVYPDALAIAPYFGHEIGARLAKDEAYKSTPVVDVLGWAEQEVDTVVREAIRNHKALADKHGLQLIAYEGGQHIVTPPIHHGNQALTDKIVAVNRHAGMGELTKKYLKLWHQESGGGVMLYYNGVGPFTKFGSWSLIESQVAAPDKAPKYMAYRARLRELANEGKGAAPTAK